MGDSCELSGAVYLELWVSLASLLRSYTAAHGLNRDRQATVELGEERIVLRHGQQWLELEREGAEVSWRREDGSGGTMEMTGAGRLRVVDPGSRNRDLGHPVSGRPGPEARNDGVEMDLMAERWSRELMR